VPRHTIDSPGIRPIDLTIIDGIETISGGEGPWVRGIALQSPGVLLAGRNPVCTDAIVTAVMGYDPKAAAGSGPFPGDNHLAMVWAPTTRRRSRSLASRSGTPTTPSAGSRLNGVVDLGLLRMPELERRSRRRAVAGLSGS
jgi:hypothetical protein